MKASWIRKSPDVADEKRKGRLLVFFGGFACDDGLMKAVRIPENCDVLMLCDYRNLDCEIDLELIADEYSHVGIVAWSFGLGVAEHFKRLMNAAKIRVALCTSHCPIDETRGISEELFDKTLENLDEVGLAKFFRRVCGCNNAFKPSKKTRSSQEFREELLFLGSILKGKEFGASHWTYAIGGADDKIFLPRNLRNAWGDKLIMLGGSHFDAHLFATAFSLALRKPTSFEKSVESYDSSALIQTEVCLRMEDIFFKTFKNFATEAQVPLLGYPKDANDKISVEKVLEIGCGTGLLTKLFYPRLKNASWFLNDSSVLLAWRASKLCGNAKIFCGDAAETFMGDSYSAILSSSCFQWINGAEAFYKKLAGMLKDGGILAFSTFGENNFRQIRELSGRGLNYIALADIKSILEKNGFKLLFADEERISLNFKSAMEVLKHIRATGVHGDFKSFWTPKKAAAFVRKYAELFPSKNGGILLDYHPIYILARKVGGNH